MVNPIMVCNFAFLYDCTPAGVWHFSLKYLSINERVWALCCVYSCAHWGLTVGFVLLRYSVVCTVESLYFFISFLCTRRWFFNKLVTWSTSELRVRMVPWNMFQLSSNYFTDRSKAVLLLWILSVICVLFVFVILSCLFLAALWSPAGKGPADLLVLLCMIISCVLSLFCPLSGVVRYCIDYWSLPSPLFL